MRERTEPDRLEGVQGQSPRHIEDVAAIYGKLFARTDPEWEATMSAVLEAAQFRLLPRPAQNQYRQLREQSDLLELVEPGAPARAHVLVDSPKPTDSPIFIRGQAETPGQVVPRRFLEVLSGTNRPTLSRRQRTTRTRQRHREQDQSADRSCDGQSRLAASFR